jgi:3',5'-cyclic AMP phosphodiesterase CpdA
MVRIVQISDTHLSPTKRHFHDNWKPLRDWVVGRKPDLVVHTGDVTVDGAGSDRDMQYCAELLKELGVPILAVPGNHDVGEPGSPHQPVDTARLARWHRYFGPDRWARDAGAWRLVGLDSMLFGSGLPEEAAQLEWLAATMAGADGRKLAWFLHRPLFLADPLEGDVGYWAAAPAARKVLLQMLREHRVALVSSGHLHRAHQDVRDGVRYVWAPSSGFVVGPSLAPPMPGESRLGVTAIELGEHGFSVAIEDIPGLRTFRIEDVINEVYPPAA